MLQVPKERTVEVTRVVHIKGERVAPGAVLTLSHWLASELVHAGKARFTTAEEQQAKAAAQAAAAESDAKSAPLSADAKATASKAKDPKQ